MKEESDDFRYPFPDHAVGVNVMHVWHDFDFSKMRIKTTEFDETIQLSANTRN